MKAGLCNMVSGCVKELVVGTIPRLLGEKNFSVQEERSGGSTGEILELKGLRWIVPSTDFLHHRRALSALSTVHLSYEGRIREGEVCCGKARTGRALQRCKNEHAATGRRVHRKSMVASLKVFGVAHCVLNPTTRITHKQLFSMK